MTGSGAFNSAGEASGEASRPASLHRAPPKPDAGERPLHLTVHEAGGALDIVAAAPLDAAERARLQARVAGIAREFGLSIRSLSLNGGTVEPHPFSQARPNHGAGTR